MNVDKNLTPAALKAMPKIDLHRHLEGSLRLETLIDIGREFGMDLPLHNVERFRPYVQIIDDPQTHEAFLSKFHVLRHFYRTPETIDRLAYEVVADAAADNIHYLELRFSPQALARVQGFALEDVTDWVITAVRRASQECQIEVGLIITLVRHDPLEQARQVAEIACRYAGQGIVGIDLAGDEVKFSAQPFSPIFKRAKACGLGVTIHAGEWANALGIWEAITELEADRIGHGVRAVENSEVLRLVRDSQKTLEVCLTSNLQSGVVQRMSHHPLLDLLDLGARVTLNTDDPSVSGLTLTDEYQVAVDVFGLDYGALRRVILNAAGAAFLAPVEQQRLVAYFESLLPLKPPVSTNAGSIP
ncbi:MAG: adenosine deaminase [Chloroflexota bacterium]